MSNHEKEKTAVPLPKKKESAAADSAFLKGVWEYEKKYGDQIRPQERPLYHLTPYTGWMNDPNGFSWYDGKYHLFYQYNPYNTVWDSMHWGHAVSEDLLCWKHMPAALAPDQEYDSFGCFSGSAETLDDGRQILMYTAVSKLPDENGNPVERQRQAIAIGDGKTYQKYENNPVIDQTMLPAGASPVDFRDPKMFRKKDGTFGAVIANRSEDGSGQILLYGSKDGLNWNYECTLLKNNRRHGLMWECPDLFELDGKDVLILSPQDMIPERLEYPSGNGTMAIIGQIDPKSGTLREQSNQSIDYGIDFYAPQTLLSPDGRRIMVAWMQNWDTVQHRKDTLGWFSQMTTPRELSIRNGRLVQQPIREIEALHTNRISYQDVLLDHESLVLDGIKGRTIDLEISAKPEEKASQQHKLIIRFAQDHRFFTEIRYDPSEQTLRMDRKYSGTRRAYIHERKMKVNTEDGKLKLRLLLDRFSAELFVNDGEQAMSMVIYTDQEADGISFESAGRYRLDVTKYDIDMNQKQ